ncbi:ROK family protein [Robertkochia marina]|uniref:ROK family protein n=1 Tax=Robertkochia marina TaxID=1227945 RepID=A0A4S3M1Z5_9FLAO|nr:ROK family protein [Robertkochia marina]THD69134.1 ROK family protein [Robertkochia marina]TRZ47606.1 ROK family protein [Robertkochia marina]
MELENSKPILGVDLGGTNIRSGRVVDGRIEQIRLSKVPKTSREQDVIDKLIKTIEDTFDQHIRGIGVGVPSLLNKKEGIVYDVQNIPSWKEVHLKQILEAHFRVPVWIDNDANCFALGERKFGAGRDFDDFVGLSIGTGLGCGIIKNGKLLPDANGCSGEFGSLFYLDSIVEDYCGSRFFINHYQATGANLFLRAQQGDQQALEAFRAYGHHLGKAIQMILFSVDPEAIILGGSIAGSWEFFSDALYQTLREFPYKNMIDTLKIIKATNTDAGILGAAALCFDP